jgi:serine/threonine-protein kinase
VHQNIMPIRDYDPGFSWYTMPIAEGTLSDLRKEVDEEHLVSILLDIAGGLDLAHREGHVHRDISPKNLLALPSNSAQGRRWVVADWGMTRRPSSEVSRVITKTGAAIGTEGYDAPELVDDPRTATPAADIYSLGRIAAWLLTGKTPRTGRELLPDGDMLHWRRFVRECTRDLDDRVQTIPEFRERLLEVLEHRDEPPSEQASRLLTGMLLEDQDNFDALVRLAEAYPDDASVYIDHIARISSGQLRPWTLIGPESAARVAENMSKHLVESPWEDRDASYVATPLSLMHTVLRSLVDHNQLAQAQDMAPSFFAADIHWNYQPQILRTVEWIDELTGQAAHMILRVLASNGAQALRHYGSQGWVPRNAQLAALLVQ